MPHTGRIAAASAGLLTLAACGSVSGHGGSIGPYASHAVNPPQIEYLLILNSQGKPRTAFHPGGMVKARLEVYSVARTLSGVRTHWRITSEGHTVRDWSVTGGFNGPSRGHLFRMVQEDRLSWHAATGTYTVSVALTVQGRHLARAARFYVRR
ncbi:MAG TPA: hypothetical protein VFB58_16320 [Chloroflexota bacterium]|nr:hypothetical protein [Chloroflexota bacterium]